MWHWFGLLLRWMFAFLLCWIAWLATPRASVMRDRTRMQRITCVSHGCILWEDRHLTTDEIRALTLVHALQHRKKQFTISEIVGTQENE